MKLAFALQVAVLAATSCLGCRTEEKPPETSTVEVTSVRFYAVRDGDGASHAPPDRGISAATTANAAGYLATDGGPAIERGSLSVTEWTANGPRSVPPPDLHDMGMHHPPTAEDPTPTR